MYIGVDIGGTKILVASSDRKFKLLDSAKITSPADQNEAMRQIIELIGEVAKDQTIDAIGIAAPGPLDRADGRLLNPPNLPWHNFELLSPLRQRFNAPVALDNDADAAALAESQLGAGQGYDPLLYVTISTGIGTGLIVNNQIYHGAYDPEGGHIVLDPNGPRCSCGGRGHFESLVSGRAIKRRFGQFAYQITDHHTWDLIAHDIALGLSNLIAITSPQIVVLGGGVSVHFDKFKKPLRYYLQDFVSPLYPAPNIVPAKNMETAAVYGAFLLAANAASKNL